VTAQPQRRATRQEHLDARVVPVERALLARADDLENLALSARGASAALGAPVLAKDNLPADAAYAIAAEFRALAEELHWRLSGSRCRTPAATSWSSTLTRSCR
jgi:hypothetical protein